MSYSAKIILDSLAPCGVRLTTFEISLPKFLQAELNTHRIFSRNSASTRAIPTAKLVERVMNDPVLPVFWGKNQPGMQAAEELAPAERAAAEQRWLIAREDAVYHAGHLLDVGLHKQIAGRLIEPWMFSTVIISATEYQNFFAQRCHVDAQPEFHHVADLMRAEYDSSTPRELVAGQWHMPYVTDGEVAFLSDSEARRVSVARCARVSYLTHDGQHDPAADIKLYDRLVTSGHWSPFEHVARALSTAQWLVEAQSSFWNFMRDGTPMGNYRGWMQLRKTIQGEFRGAV